AYRPEIDGLRAVAVLSVLLCHADFALFSGGYVGVDTFFVISGFLITALIKKDLEAGSFSFVNFWERRIRRILPPLLTVVISALIAGWFLYLPGDYRMLGQQTAAQAVFASNILFKFQAGYFDTENIIKPLLHTWSLAVEEQFYFFFPVAFFVVWKYRKEKTFNYFLIFAGISFIAAAFIVRNSPSSAFYLLPFRAWELMIGALLALRPVTLYGWKKELAGWAGLVSILIAVISYTDHTLFPGAAALLPCLGAAAIIVSNNGSLNSAGKTLSLRVPVFIGLVSYSLYLWHWPILAFIRYSGLIDFTMPVALLCLLTSFVLAVLSWKFIEAPFRKKQILATTKGIYVAALASLAVMGAAGFSVYYTNGFPQRLPGDVVAYAEGADDINPYRESCNKPKFDRFEKGEICQSNAGQGIEPDFVLWGDSFADAIAPAFYELSKEYKRNGYVVTAHGCPPILNYEQNADIGFDCVGFNNRVFSMIKEKKIKHVFLSGNWTDRMVNPIALFRDQSWYPPYKDRYENMTMAATQRTVDELQKMGVQVYVFLDVPFAPFNPPRKFAINSLYKINKSDELSLSKKSFLNARQQSFGQFIDNNKNSDVIFIGPESIMCDDEKCYFEAKGRSLYFNEGHLSNFGALYLKDMFTEYFRKGF
ncbi:MAG: hypothetical protein DI586_09780, partial [Micavibrio aeruginosavorus]